MLCWLDGRLLDVRDARISPLDAGWRLGDGVFSTLRAVDGVPQQLGRHVARLLHDASALGITGVDRDRVATAARTVAEGNGAEHPDLVLRLVVTRGPVAPDAPFGAVPRTPTVAVLASPAPTPLGRPLRVVTAEGGRRPATIKSTSWAWSAQAIATARAAGADTAILVEGGVVLEAAAANVVVVSDGTATTPPDDGRILPGTTRAVLVAAGHVTEARITTTDLTAADEVVLLSAVRGAVPVGRVDDRPVGDGGQGPVATELAAVLRTAGVGPPER